MLTQRALASGLNKAYVRKSGETPGSIQFMNTGGGTVTVKVYVTPVSGGDVQIDQGDIGAGEPAETDLTGWLEVGEAVKVDASGTGVNFMVTGVKA